MRCALPAFCASIFGYLSPGASLDGARFTASRGSRSPEQSARNGFAPPAKVPRQGRAPRCPLQLAPPECRDRQPPRRLASLPRAAPKLLPAGKASLASHSLKAAAGLVFSLWQVGSEVGFPPSPHPLKEAGCLLGKGSGHCDRGRSAAAGSARLGRPESSELSPFSLRLEARWQRSQRELFTETLE